MDDIQKKLRKWRILISWKSIKVNTKVDMKYKNPGKYQGFKAGAVGIEPTSTVLETAVLPLNYAPIYPVFQPPNAIITYRRFPCQD